MYDKTHFFNAYFARATEKKLIVDSFNKHLNLKSNSKLLDLGCHNGGLMQQLVDRYHDQFSNSVKIVGIDPSQDAIAEYLRRDFNKVCSVDAMKATAEDYFKQNTTTFDWIIASQCLYWSLDLNDIIDKIYKNSQNALIVLRGDKGIYEIQSTFKEYLGNKQEQLYTAADIEHQLTKASIPYAKEYHKTAILLPDYDSEEFNWLIAFFLQTLDTDLTQGILSEVKNFIIKKAHHHALQHDIVLFWLHNAQATALYHCTAF